MPLARQPCGCYSGPLPPGNQTAPPGADYVCLECPKHTDPNHVKKGRWQITYYGPYQEEEA